MEYIKTYSMKYISNPHGKKSEILAGEYGKYGNRILATNFIVLWKTFPLLKLVLDILVIKGHHGRHA